MSLLFLTFLAPIIGFLILSVLNENLSETKSAFIGVGSMLVSALVALYVGIDFLQQDTTMAYTQHMWTWMAVGDFKPTFTLYLDGLSLTMLGVVTGVGFFIHLFASWYMRGEEGYARFFSYMNLFIASMLFLVLGDNLLFIYFGWEGVGICSYLLIGFYFKNAANGKAAMKAFIITRVGDVFMAIGLFLLYYIFGTLNIQAILQAAPEASAHVGVLLPLAALMILGGAVGKSAQLPLQTWLPDAMAGPTPVSALIHAATMVTAGVYLIARTHTLFELAPNVQQLVGFIGATTLLLAGFAALVQSDIKRILAYSTMSQIGYMFLALGVGAWSAAIFHLMIHAFFKALLFLTAGAVIVATHHEQDIFKMGGLRKKLPLEYLCFLVGGAALAALPIVTSGFYSKDEILWETLASGHSGFLTAGLIGAFMTSLYTFRLIFIVFHGEVKTDAHKGHGLAYALPLMVLLILSTGLGALITPPLQTVLPVSVGVQGGEMKHTLELISAGIALSGVALAAFLYLGKHTLVTRLAANPLARLLASWWRNAWGFDWLYNVLFVKPYVSVARYNRLDAVDVAVGLIPTSAKIAHRMLSVTQNGRIRWYALTIATGAFCVIAAAVLM
jgi:NADH-quinone oxidoreductase subunit L